MKKLIFTILLLLPISIFALEYPNLHYQNAYIYDLTDNKVLYELNKDEKSSIASLTKIMTTITTLELVDNLDDTVIITSNMLNQVRWDASIAGLKVGDKVTYRDLLYASILPSGADATIALAITTSGTVDNFVKKMNNLAESLGMKNSHFVNVHGLDEKGHYSTAYDIKLLLEYSLKNKTFKEIYTTKEYTLTNNLNVKSTVLKTGNKLNLDTTRILGSKTGFTLDAGLCMSALINSDNHEILIITLRAPTDKSYHLLDTLELIKFIDSNYNYHPVIEKEKLKKRIQVNNSKIDNYEIKNTEEIYLFLPNDYDKNLYKVEYNGLEEISYKNQKDTILGTITYKYKDEILKEEKVILNIEIEPDYKKIVSNNKTKIIATSILTIIFIVTIIYILRKTHK